MVEPDFLRQDSDTDTKAAKWNIFRFQDHLNYWIDLVAINLDDGDYSRACRTLTTLFSDTRGFYNKKNQGELDKLFKEMLKENADFMDYNAGYIKVREKMKTQSYAPPQGLYISIVNFRFALMDAMAKYQLLIPMIKKGIGEAVTQ